MKRIALTAIAITAFQLMVAATGIAIPYTSSLYEDEDWTVVNVNPDSRTWKDSSSSYDFSNSGYSEGKYYSYDYYEPADDWLISPAIPVEGGKEYKVSFSYRCCSKREKLELLMAEGNSLEILETGTRLFDYDGSSTSFKKSVSVVRPVESTNLYFGIHAYSPADVDYIYVTGFEIKENVFVPAPVSGLQCVIDPDEKLRCDLSWILPTTDLDGAPMAEDAVYNNVTVYRDDIEIATLDGDATVFCDSPETGLTAGIHKYAVSVTINGIESTPTTCTSLFIGPIPPKELPWTAGLADLSSDTFAQEWKILKGEDSEVRDDYGWILSYGQLQFGPGFSGINEDDWVVLPKINFPKSGAYRFRYRGVYSGSQPSMDLHMATSGNIESLAPNKVGEINVFEKSSSNVNHDLIFLVDEPGNYFPALHACRKDIPSYTRYYFYELEFEAAEILPLPVNDLSGEVNGDEVILRWSLPAKDNVGQLITVYDHVDLYRDETLVKSFEDVAGGTTMEYIEKPGKGIFRYKIIPVLSGKEPETEGYVLTTDYVGDRVQDLPYTLDFSEDYDSVVTEALWETINFKKDDYKWNLQSNGWTLNLDSYGGTTNDALLTPPFNLQPRIYDISLSVRGATRDYPLCIGVIDEDSFTDGLSSFTEVARILLNGSSSQFSKHCIEVELNVSTIGRFVIFTDPSVYYDDYPYNIVVNSFAVGFEPFQSISIPYETKTFENFAIVDCDEEKDYCWEIGDTGLTIDTDGWNSDDWAVSPMFAFEENKKFVIQMEAEVTEGKIELYAGTGLRRESMEDLPICEITESGDCEIYVTTNPDISDSENIYLLPSATISFGLHALGEGTKAQILSFAINEDITTTVSALENATDTDYVVYDMTGQKVKHPVKGNIYILKYSDGTVKKIIF